MSEENKGIWNGGDTFNTKYDKMIRESEDYYDEIDSETDMRESLKKRQKVMDETRIERKPMHELYKGINKQINNFEEWSKERTPWSKMGGVQRKK